MSYTHTTFSEVLPELTNLEEEWLREQLQIICILGNEENTEFSLLDELNYGEPDWTGNRFLHDNPGRNRDDDSLGCEYRFQNDHDYGRHLWLHAEGNGNPHNAALLAQMFLAKFHPNGCWTLTFSVSNSRWRCCHYGGGAAFVTANEIKWWNAHDLINDQRTAFKERKKK